MCTDRSRTSRCHSRSSALIGLPVPWRACSHTDLSHNTVYCDLRRLLRLSGLWISSQRPRLAALAIEATRTIDPAKAGNDFHWRPRKVCTMTDKRRTLRDNVVNIRATHDTSAFKAVNICTVTVIP